MFNSKQLINNKGEYMRLQFDNLKLVDQVNEALIVNGLQADISHKRISDKSLLLRLQFSSTELYAGEQFQRQLYLFNVNDGKHALRMYCGLFRLACSNGLIIPVYTGSAHGLRIVHRDCKPTHEKLNQLPELIMDGMYAITNGTTEIINTARALPINSPEQAIQVIGNLSVSDQVKYHSIRRWYDRDRPADLPNDAWSLYNTVNETIRLYHGTMTRTTMQQNASLYEDVITLTESLQGAA